MLKKSYCQQFGASQNELEDHNKLDKRKLYLLFTVNTQKDEYIILLFFQIIICFFIDVFMHMNIMSSAYFGKHYPMRLAQHTILKLCSF